MQKNANSSHFLSTFCSIYGAAPHNLVAVLKKQSQFAGLQPETLDTKL